MAEEEKPKKGLNEEYVKAVVALCLAGAAIVLLAAPIVALVLGFAVRCFNWAAG
jgi:hypothetical protein